VAARLVPLLLLLRDSAEEIQRLVDEDPLLDELLELGASSVEAPRLEVTQRLDTVDESSAESVDARSSSARPSVSRPAASSSSA
jgi:hypothetical protein